MIHLNLASKCSNLDKFGEAIMNITSGLLHVGNPKKKKRNDVIHAVLFTAQITIRKDNAKTTIQTTCKLHDFSVRSVHSNDRKPCIN